MASQLALAVIEPAILDHLRTDGALLALVRDAGDGNFGIYDFVPQGTPRNQLYPYVRVSGGSERPFNTLGTESALKYGSIAVVTVRAVSQSRGSQEVYGVMSAVKARLDGRKLTFGSYGAAIVTCEHVVPLTDQVGGVITRELVAEFDVTVHQ